MYYSTVDRRLAGSCSTREMLMCKSIVVVKSQSFSWSSTCLCKALACSSMFYHHNIRGYLLQG
jgi:hypothetical protein